MRCRGQLLGRRRFPSALGLASARWQTWQTRCCQRICLCSRGNHRAVNRSKDGAGVIEKHAPWRKQRHTSRRAIEELRANLVFQRPDMPTNRGLRDVKALGGATHVSLLGNGDEIADLREAHVSDRAGRREVGQAEAAYGARPKRYWIVGARSRHDAAMAIEILSLSQIERMRRAGRLAAETLAFVGSRLRPGMSTAEIDRLVREDTARRGGRPSQLGYSGFPAAVCTSRNNVVCHGIPSPRELLQVGDIINIDVTTNIDGYHGDTSAMFLIGEVSADAKRIVDVARRCRDVGIAVIRDGARLGDIGAAIEELARNEGVGVVKEIGGHGIGRQMHADPHVAHTGKRGSGPRLKAGMAITVEPMVNLGSAATRQLDDGWTIVTADGSLSAQWEHTVVVTRDGYEIMTNLA
jgi:methionyl aminopeptidase